MSTRKRCHIALGLSKHLSKFVQQNRLSRKLCVVIYNTVLFPLISWGLKTRVLTRRNRKGLRRYERLMLSNMLRFAKVIESENDGNSRNVRSILNGRTITRRIKVFRINFWGHIKRRPQTHMLQLAKNYYIGEQKLGRPCFTYKDSMKEVFSNYNTHAESWEEISQNKKELRKEAMHIFEACENDSSSDDELNAEQIE